MERIKALSVLVVICIPLRLLEAVEGEVSVAYFDRDGAPSLFSEGYGISAVKYLASWSPRPDAPEDQNPFAQRIGALSASFLSDEKNSADGDGSGEQYRLSWIRRAANSPHVWRVAYSRAESESRTTQLFGLPPADRFDLGQRQFRVVPHEPESQTFDPFENATGVRARRRVVIGDGAAQVPAIWQGWIDRSIFQQPSITTRQENESDVVSLGYDRYIGANWTVGTMLSYSDSESEISTEPPIIADGVTGTEAESLGVGVQTRRLWSLANDRWVAFSGSLEYTDSDSRILGTIAGEREVSRDYWSFALQGRYYFSRMTSLDAGWRYSDLGDASNLELGLSHFFTSSWFGSIEFTHASLPGGSDADGWGLSAGLRF